MAQTDNPKDTVSSTRRSAISRADLLRVWYSADRDGPDAAMWLANELDFEFIPPQPDQGVESSAFDFSLEPTTLAPAAPTRAETRPPAATAVESMWLPSKYLVGASSNGDPQIEMARPAAELAWTKRPVALPPIGLATWPEAKTRLSPILEPPRRSPSIDIDKLVDLMSQGHLLSKLPTETFYRLERTVYVVEDRSARLFPYHRDQQWLIGLLRFHLPRGYFSQLACIDPRTKVDPNRSIDEAISGLKNQEPQAGSQILVLGDLGILDTSWRLQGYWNEWIQEQARRDCRVSAMVPFPLDRVPSGFREIAGFYSWQHSGVQSVLDRSRREELVAEILSRLSPASSFDPVLLRWVRQSVSEAGDAALESFVWQDKSLDSNQYSSAKNDRVESKKEFREAFHGLDAKTKRGVLRLLRESRAGLGEDPSVWFVELLSLTPEELELVESKESDFEDVQRAIRYMDDHRGQREIGGSIRSFLSWFSKRVETDGVWARDPGISETIRRWQREFHPKRTLDARTRIGEIKRTGDASAEITAWLRAVDDGLSIRKKSADRSSRGDTVLLKSTGRVLEIHGQEDRERAFWKSGVKPDWVSDYGMDPYGAWCEFQVPRHDGKRMVTQRMRWIKPGEFLMGSPEGEVGRFEDDSPAHSVKLTQGYWMADTQVTQELWMAIGRGENPSDFKGESNPVENVSWKDCHDWFEKLCEHHESLQLSLPTEAQWEYACRAGSQSAYCFGDDPRELPKYGWFGEDSTHPVKQLQPNGWGLYEMHGNVWEWCSDWFDKYAPSAQSDPTGPTEGTSRVVRGGGWDDPARDLRSACRDGSDPGFRGSALGFRLLSSALRAEPSERAMLPVAEQGTERARIGSAEPAYEFLRSVDLDATGDSTPEEEFSQMDVKAYASIRVVSDQEGYQFDRLEKPTWAVDFGSDSYGLYATFEIKPVRQRMRWIPPGRFFMGSPAGKDYERGNEGPQHEVIITHGYWMFDTPCTQGLWTALMGDNPSYFLDPERPVEQVSWVDAVGFAKKLNERLAKGLPLPNNGLIDGWERLQFRLPTESEWENACRAGTTGDTYVGDLDLKSRDQTKAEILDSSAWYGGNSGHKYDLENSMEMTWLEDLQAEEKRGGTRKVAQKALNAWGLYDMLGNVWEWCQDWYGEYPAEPVDRVEDPIGPTEGTSRVIRGGSWHDPARYLRSACRDGDDPGDRDNVLGFRLLSSAHRATESGEEASQSEVATRGRGTRPRGSDE